MVKQGSAAREEIAEMVYDFFSQECGVERSKLSPATHIVEDLQGDSLMLLSLLEMVRKKYGLRVELKTLGKHLMRKPANTIGQVIDLTLAVAEHGDNILNVEI